VRKLDLAIDLLKQSDGMAISKAFIKVLLSINFYA